MTHLFPTGILAATAIGAPFIPTLDQLRPFAVESWLVVTIVAVLLAPFFTRRANFICGGIALVGVLLALATLIFIGSGDNVVGEHFRGMLLFDPVSFFWKIILLVFVAGVIIMWFATTASTLHEGDGPEFFTLLLGATLGMCLMASTSNLLMLLMSVELASLPSYVMAGFRKTNRIGAEASLKYVLFGAVTSAIMAYGLSILYGLYGSLQLHDLAATMTTTLGGSALLVVAVFGLIVGIGFKISAVPFHFWCPDVFEGASIDVTTFLSVASKGAGLILLLRVVETIGNASGFVANGTLTSLAAVIAVLGCITATVGNTGAFVQTNIKRLLAYSSIAHAGYMLCVVSLLMKSKSAQPGFLPANTAAQAILLYLAVYAFMNLGAFTVAALVSRQTGTETLEGFRALGRRAPILAFCMFCCMISLIGLPPFAGFGAKLNVLWALFQNGGAWWAVIVVIGINTIVSAFYYFRVLRAMYLETSTAPPLSANPLGILVSAVCALVLIVLFFGFGSLSKVATSYDQLYLSGSTVVDTNPPTAIATR
jgi:NADH-quinone oxidoreductase subunit N